MWLERGDLLAIVMTVLFLSTVVAIITIAIVILRRKRSVLAGALAFGPPLLLCSMTLSVRWLVWHNALPFIGYDQFELLVLANSILAGIGSGSATFALPGITTREKAGLIVAGMMSGFTAHGMLVEVLW